jgi:hypothetical protein
VVQRYDRVDDHAALLTETRTAPAWQPSALDPGEGSVSQVQDRDQALNVVRTTLAVDVVEAAAELLSRPSLATLVQQ